jgi:sugar phosphate isomerase/epimerase
MKQIAIGTLVGGGNADKIIPQILPHGFESFSLTFWQTTGDTDLAEKAKQVKEALGDSGAYISALSIFGNPLTGEGKNADTLASWERLIDNAHHFGVKLITGFTGRLTDQPIPDSIDRYKASRLRIAIWAVPGSRATGTSRTIRLPGKCCLTRFPMPITLDFNGSRRIKWSA